MASGNSEPKDHILEIFMELYTNTLIRKNPWVGIEMDGDIYHLDDLYNLLERESIDNMIKCIMEGWYKWLNSYKAGKEEKIKLETMSFEEPTLNFTV